MKNVREMTDKEIKDHYYSLIFTSRKIFSEQQRIERILESPFIMCCYMVLWLLMTFIFLFFIWIAPAEGLKLFLFGGTPLVILLLTTRHYKKEWLINEKKLNYLDNELVAFRTNVEKARRELPAYPFTESSYYSLDGSLSYPFDEYTNYPFEE